MRESFYIAHQRKADRAQQSLEHHLLEVAAVSKIFSGKIGLKEQGEIIGLLHDLGKYSKQFQDYLKSAVGIYNQDEDEDFVNAEGIKGKVDHSTAGAQLIWRDLTKRSKLGELVGQILALCIASHHSGLIDCLSSDTSGPVEDNFTRRMNKVDSRTNFSEVFEKIDDSIKKRFDKLRDDPKLIDGLKESIKQIARRDGGTDDNEIVQFKIGLLVRFLFSCLIDADRINTADFENPQAAKNRPGGQYASWDLLIKRLERRLQEFETQMQIDKTRRDISDHSRARASSAKGIYTLTVPTGGGKTLASLRFALHHAKQWEMDRIIYVIPYTTIIDQNANVVRKILEPSQEDHGRIVLEHHSNLTPESQGWQEKILTENWDAPVIYTTSVQFLDVLFGAGTRGARRMHQLANAVIVFDEVQTVPVNCVHLFNNAVNFLVEHCGSTAVLCTATQPLLNRVDKNKGAMRFSEDNEIMPDVKRLFENLKRVDVRNQRKPGGWTNEEIIHLVFEEVDKVNSCLVIVNTKKSAQALFKLCQAKKDVPTYHLSTNMCPAHRKEILERIQNLLTPPGSQVICFSTQLIEAGVDIDFGAVIRFTAGLDSIAQAAGRCNRNQLRKIGRVHVVNPADENLDSLEDIKCGRENAERVLAEFNGDILDPQAMELYFHYYFFSRVEKMSYSIGRNDTLLNLLSVNGAACSEYCRSNRKAPNIYLRQSFMSAAKAFKAIDTPTRGVIVPYGKYGMKLIGDLCSASDTEKAFKFLRQAQQYTVNVFPNTLNQMQRDGAICQVQENIDILYLSDARYYNQYFGLTTTSDGTMETLYV